MKIHVVRKGTGSRRTRYWSRSCPLSRPGAPKIDYKDPKMLSRYLSERGKIISNRLSSVAHDKQRILARTIKRARYLALLPYTTQQ